jgi:hypothetical protein
VSTDPDPHRERLVERFKALRAHNPAAPDRIKMLLPAGIAALGGAVALTPGDFDAYDKAIGLVERDFEMPFNPPPTPPAALRPFFDPAPPVAPVVLEPRTFDEGDPIDDETVDAMLAKMATLAGTDGEQWARQMLREARDAGVGISLRATRSKRMFEITRALYLWAEAYADDELARCALVHVLGDDRVQPGFPTGAVIGALERMEAAFFCSVVAGVEAGRLVYVVDAQGSRLERATL